MNAHNMPAKPPLPSDLVKEYDAKLAAIPDAIAAFERAENALKMAASVRGTFGDSVLSGRGGPGERQMKCALLASAWKSAYGLLNIKKVASASDRNRFELSMKNPPEFTIDNIAATFGDYIKSPRFHILRGLAEVFCALDPAYKSHSKVKMGVKGLPKRVILTNVGHTYTHTGGAEQLLDLLNALRTYEGRPHIEYITYSNWLTVSRGKAHPWRPGGRYSEGSTVEHDGDVYISTRYTTAETWNGAEWSKWLNPEPGLTLKVFGNGNGHLHFSADKLTMINRALAEFYGDVLPDTPDAPEAKRPGTDVAKSLQFYRTPPATVAHVLRHVHIGEGAKVLEPSCGDGAFLDAIRAEQARATVTGIEVDRGRFEICEAKGHRVLRANFLDCAPDPVFDLVIMNPPFYGRHYLKHIRHALKFLKPGGELVAILPASAWYDHKELQSIGTQSRYDAWRDLPVGSFSDSGTNVSTGVFKCFA